MKRRLPCILLVLLLCSGLFAPSAFAAASCSLMATAGETTNGRVSVDILLTENPGITGLVFAVDYDASKLRPVGAWDGGALPNAVLGPDGLSYAWSDAAASYNTGCLLSLEFEVLASGWTTAYVSIFLDAESVADASGTRFIGAASSDACIVRDASGDPAGGGSPALPPSAAPSPSIGLDFVGPDTNGTMKPETSVYDRDVRIPQTGGSGGLSVFLLSGPFLYRILKRRSL